MYKLWIICFTSLYTHRLVEIEFNGMNYLSMYIYATHMSLFYTYVDMFVHKVDIQTYNVYKLIYMFMFSIKNSSFNTFYWKVYLIHLYIMSTHFTHTPRHTGTVHPHCMPACIVIECSMVIFGGTEALTNIISTSAMIAEI